MDTNMPTALRRAIAACGIASTKDEWWIRDLTDSYPWLTEAQVLWVIDTVSDLSAVVLGESDGTFSPLNVPDALPVISRVLAQAFPEGPMPRLGDQKFATLLMQWHLEPRGYVLSPAFYARKQNELDSWLMGTEKNAESLRALCVPLQFQSQENGWTFAFNVIDKDGGVGQREFAGTSRPFYILTSSAKAIKAEGTFYYPDEL